LKEIGAVYGITRERVRQILEKKNLKLCAKHQVHFLEKCWRCTQQSQYKKKLKNLHTDKELREEAKRLSAPGRTGKPVLERKLLIKKLINERGMSYSEVSRLLKRDRTTIMHLHKSRP
jgi:AraC-like DNA-binding protein